MCKYYEEPTLNIKKFNMQHSIFTDSGDPHDDDEFDLDGGSPGNDAGMNVFGN